MKVQNVSKSFGTAEAVRDVSLEINSGQVLTLLGPSGCGKTTLLRCIAGLESPDSGVITIGENVVNAPSEQVFIAPENRRIGMVFQSYALWPHLTVEQNIAYPLDASKSYSRSETESRVAESLELVQLEGLGPRYPSEISGGQQQRVALARALVFEPDVLLLDEPLSNLDAQLRESMRVELRDLQNRLKITTIYVTHDQTEALALSDRIGVMRQGEIVQFGTPDEIFRTPKTEFVATFLGALNVLPGTIIDENRVDTPLGQLRCTFSTDLEPGDSAIVTIHPGYVELVSTRNPEVTKPQTIFEGRITDQMFGGDWYEYTVSIGETKLRMRTTPAGNRGFYQVGDEALLGIPEEACVAMPVELANSKSKSPDPTIRTAP